MTEHRNPSIAEADCPVCIPRHEETQRIEGFLRTRYLELLRGAQQDPGNRIPKEVSFLILAIAEFLAGERHT